MGEIALDYEQLSDVELASFVVRRDPHAVRVILLLALFGHPMTNRCLPISIYEYTA
jgi:hypothetical protein